MEPVSVTDFFFRRAAEARWHAAVSGQRFVHYTTAAVATSIIRNKSVWMRNALTMNDFSEIEHGVRCLASVWNSAVGQNLRELLDSGFPGLSSSVQTHFDNWLPSFREETYLACLSEHDESEDELGRLSMWRAYGGTSGVALVLNNTPFVSISDALKAYSYPVFYAGLQAFEAEFSTFVDSISARRDELYSLGRDALASLMMQKFIIHTLCTKHPGFSEEREWRVVYSPKLQPSPYIQKSIEIVRDIPQLVYKIPLVHDPDMGLYHADVPSLLNRLIIGPTHSPLTILQAMRELLSEANVPDPNSKVYVSQIPLRH